MLRTREIFNEQRMTMEIPAGHPADTFLKENQELLKLVRILDKFYDKINRPEDLNLKTYLIQLKGFYNDLVDVDKHYQRKENLLFPYIEKHGITDPQKGMWDRHNEIREMLKTAMESISPTIGLSVEKLKTIVNYALRPVSEAISDMIEKEKEILWPVCLEKLSDNDWYQISLESGEFGFCLYEPATDWIPEGMEPAPEASRRMSTINLPTGKFSIEELILLFKNLPVELSFVDKHDKVRFFSQGKTPIFRRSQAVIGRDVRLCHPPRSVHLVEEVLNHFRNGKHSKATSWLEIKGKMVCIEYYALRDEKDQYLGTLEVVQDITDLRNIDKERRLLTYS